MADLDLLGAIVCDPELHAWVTGFAEELDRRGHSRAQQAAVISALFGLILSELEAADALAIVIAHLHTLQGFVAKRYAINLRVLSESADGGSG